MLKYVNIINRLCRKMKDKIQKKNMKRNSKNQPTTGNRNLRNNKKKPKTAIINYLLNKIKKELNQKMNSKRKYLINCLQHPRSNSQKYLLSNQSNNKTINKLIILPKNQKGYKQMLVKKCPLLLNSLLDNNWKHQKRNTSLKCKHWMQNKRQLNPNY